MEFKGDVTYSEVCHVEIAQYSNVLYFQCSYNVQYYPAYLKTCLTVNFSVLSLKFWPVFSFLFLTQFEDYISSSS